MSDDDAKQILFGGGRSCGKSQIFRTLADVWRAQGLDVYYPRPEHDTTPQMVCNRKLTQNWAGIKSGLSVDPPHYEMYQRSVSYNLLQLGNVLRQTPTKAAKGLNPNHCAPILSFKRPESYRRG